LIGLAHVADYISYKSTGRYVITRSLSREDIDYALLMCKNFKKECYICSLWAEYEKDPTCDFLKNYKFGDRYGVYFEDYNEAMIFKLIFA